MIFRAFLLAVWGGMTLPLYGASQPEILEVLSSIPTVNKSSAFQTSTVAPVERALVGFGGSAQGVCGPSPQTNSLQCLNFIQQGGFGQSTLPFFGPLSTTPVAHQGDWLLGTARGVLARVAASDRGLPDLKGAMIGMWGSQSRLMLQQPKNLDPTLRWTFSSAAPFAGTPQIYEDKVYAVSLNHYVQAFDWNTGQPLWAGRLSGETPLSFTNTSLTMTPDGLLLVGTPQGSLVAYDADTGKEQWKASFPLLSDRLASSIVAPPLVQGQWVVVSQAGAKTQGILRTEGNRMVWQVNLGSVATPVLASNQTDIFLGTAQGSIARIGLEDGRLFWQTPILTPEPVVAMMLVSEKFLLAATGNGELFLVNTDHGSVQAKLYTGGQVVGNFLRPESLKPWSHGCLSFASTRLRCFWVKLP